MTDFISKRRARMIAYCEATPDEIHATSYDDMITDEQANMLLSGDFDGFNESMYALTFEWHGQAEYWEGEFATEFGYDDFDAMPERIQMLARDHYICDESPYVETAIKQWRGHIVATILKPGAKEPENLIYAPGYPDEEQDQKLARYLIDAFGIKLRATEGNKTARLMQDIEVVYGGYDREQLVLCGTLDLLAIYKAQKVPTHVNIGPEDVDHLLFYEFHNGCGNMGSMGITKTRKMPATFKVDGTYGYGVDSCYGFVGSWWRHEIRAA